VLTSVFTDVNLDFGVNQCHSHVAIFYLLTDTISDLLKVDQCVFLIRRLLFFAVSCPVCSVCVPERSINVHLDRCLRNDTSDHCVSVRSVVFSHFLSYCVRLIIHVYSGLNYIPWFKKRPLIHMSVVSTNVDRFLYCLLYSVLSLFAT